MFCALLVYCWAGSLYNWLIHVSKVNPGNRFFLSSFSCSPPCQKHIRFYFLRSQSFSFQCITFLPSSHFFSGSFTQRQLSYSLLLSTTISILSYLHSHRDGWHPRVFYTPHVPTATISIAQQLQGVLSGAARELACRCIAHNPYIGLSPRSFDYNLTKLDILQSFYFLGLLLRSLQGINSTHYPLGAFLFSWALKLKERLWVSSSLFL